ncbi:MAG: MarR family transcriptional regulator [Xylanivirga thermophila]|jgi:DNA-binding MarR family transcriptional regulator|uniref:MarR family winged helix-turn-helix transcriptional regulator n=1 Tax=Xylanivirga thermophila TaxID=2496273 RepID=UPI00101D67A2|nr:MarR family transcriptional regulator [Xylanivirga thermophila]
MTNDDIFIIDDLLRKITNKYESIESKSRAFKHLKDLTITEIKTIYAIGDDRPKTMKEIARELNVSVSTPTTTIDRLIDKKYVDRYTGTEDRRQVLVKLTKEGIRILKEIRRIKIETTEFILRVLTYDELEFMKEILVKVNAGLQV